MQSVKQNYFCGSRLIHVADQDLEINFPVLMHYPTTKIPAEINFGPFTMNVANDGDVTDGTFPLIIISHGNSGSRYVYRSISTFLAKKGFVVAMPEHHGNNRANNELADTKLNLQLRPKHVRLTIDHLLADSFFQKHADHSKICIIGHSFGGYTALALAGGLPKMKTGEDVAVLTDNRIKAMVLMAPAAPYFLHSGALKNVDIPALLLTAEKDVFTPKAWTSDVILNGVADRAKISWKEIPNAGHFSFLTPFPPSMHRPDFMPSTDPPGFNRDAFHAELPQMILDFFNTTFS